jgi:hypothetical protein
MSGEFSVVEKSIKEILIDLMADKFMSIGEQDSSTRGLQLSPSTACQSGPSRTATRKQTKHCDDLVNAKLIPSILPDYIPPLAGAVIPDSVLRDFDYTVITTYFLKGIHTVRL